jgi:alkanesulfonate monooxygenase SsuD/methylene tetrahydromethanopterin reductase-like flavin-dependent oxidoreductase (luciferase family)
MRERIEAMQQIWTTDEASYEGRHVSFDRIWSWPKPVQKPHPPVLFATLGPSPLVIRHADGWLPLSNKDPAELPGRIAELRERAAAAGRDRAGLEITVFSL